MSLTLVIKMAKLQATEDTTEREQNSIRAKEWTNNAAHLDLVPNTSEKERTYTYTPNPHVSDKRVGFVCFV